jgi:sporulation protein YlmC with PRC-barrel domain
VAARGAHRCRDAVKFRACGDIAQCGDAVARVIYAERDAALHVLCSYVSSLEVHMIAKQFAAGLLATTLLSGVALAQTPAPSQSSSTPRAEATATPIQEQSSNEWRASKVIGLYVYNDADERLGAINDLLTDANGKIEKAVIGVGGFLGIGESNVAVNFDQLKFAKEPMRTSSASTTTSAPATNDGMSRPGAGTVGSATTTTTSAPAKPTVNPDHAKLSMTKEQLKAMPQFKYVN